MNFWSFDSAVTSIHYFDHIENRRKTLWCASSSSLPELKQRKKQEARDEREIGG